MFDSWSRPRPARRPAAMSALSLSLHAAVIYGVVRLAPAPTEPSPVRGRVASSTTRRCHPSPGRPSAVRAVRLCRCGLPGPVPPPSVPVGPPVGIPMYDADDGRPAVPDLPGTLPAEPGDFASVGVQVFNDRDLDEPPVPVVPARPEYPAGLQGGGVGGDVVVTYIVGLDGQVEPGTIVVQSADRPEFGRAVREALRSARFRPGRIHGMVVRVRVRQRVRFQAEGT